MNKISLHSSYNGIVLFILSVLACMFVLLVERVAGIEWDFHPDANTYVTISDGTIDNFTLGNYFGGLYYILVDLADSQVWLLITFNIFIYSMTNVALGKFFKKHVDRQKVTCYFLFLCVIFNPYRIHLSVHVLKDTLIIFGLVYYFTAHRKYAWLFFVLSYAISVRSVIYLTAFLNRRNFLIVSMPIMLFIFIQPDGWLLSVLSSEHSVNMTFRDFDKVPNFFELGLLGAIIRALLWPFIFLTGVFYLISPTIMYLPIALGSLLLQLWHFKQFGRGALYFQVYVSLSILAFMVSGFTSFIRYGLPMLTILPILVIRANENRYGK